MSVITISQVVVPNYQGGGSTAQLRIAANDDFLTSDNVQIFISGVNRTFYKIVNCTVSGTDLTIPDFTIDTTTDSSKPAASYNAVLFDSAGRRVSTYWFSYQIPTIFGTTATHEQIRIYNDTPKTIAQYGYPNIQQVQALIDTAVSGIVAGNASVTSAKHLSGIDRISVNSAQMTSADGALSGRVTSVVDALSQQASSLSARIAVNSAQMTSADAALQNAVSVVSNALSSEAAALSGRINTNSAQMTSADNAISAAVVNKAISTLVGVSIAGATSAQVLTYNSAQGVWQAFNPTAGSGSVTSKELSIAAAGLSTRVDSVANAVSALSNANSAAHVSINSRIDTTSGAVAANSAQMVSADNAISNAVSIVSQALSVEIAARVALSGQVSTIASALSARIDTQSQAISVLSQQASALSARVASNSAQMTSADNAISAAVASVQSILSTTRSSLSALSADVTSAKGRIDTNSAQMTSADNAISNAVSIVSVAVVNKTVSTLVGVSINGATSGQVFTYNSVDGKWHASTVAAGTGSVTSNELSAAAAGLSARVDSAVNAVSVVSNALSAAGVALSARIDSVFNAASVISNAVSALSNANSAAHVSINSRIDTVSNAISAKHISGLQGVSIASPTSAQVLVYKSADAKWSNSTQAAGSGSVTSNELSAAAAGLSTRLDSVANAISVVSNARSATDAALSARIDSVANAASVISNALSALSQANSAAHTSLDGRINSLQSALSTALSAISALSQTNSANHVSINARIDTVSNALSAKHLSGLQGVSIASPTSAQVLVYKSADAKWSNSTPTGGSGSVTSQELSVAAAGLSARIDSVANAVSVLSQAVSVLSVAVGTVSNYASTVSNQASIVSVYKDQVSNYASIVSATAAGLPQVQIRIVSNTQSTTQSILTDISGLNLTLNAGETWEVRGMILVSTSVATAGLRLGCSVGALSLPRFIRFDRPSAAQSAGILAGAGLMQASGTSQFFSAANVGGVLAGVNFNAVFNAASTSNFQMMYCGIASVAASPIHIMPGTFMICTRLK